MWDFDPDPKRVIQKRITDATIRMSQEMLNPQMADFNELDAEAQRERVIEVLVALTFCQALLASKFLNVAPEEMGRRMGNFLRDNMTTLKEHQEKEEKEQAHGAGTTQETESVWD